MNVRFKRWHYRHRCWCHSWGGSKTDESFAFAGLWERWHPDVEPIDTFCFITTEPNSMREEYHDRQPVMLLESEWGSWLDREHHGTDVMSMLAGLLSHAMEAPLIAHPASGTASHAAA